MGRPEVETASGAGAETRRWTLVFAVLTLALGTAAALLVRENRRLRGRLEVLAAEKARGGGLDLGRALAPVRLVDAQGASVEVRFEGESVGTLLLVHAAACDACAATAERWREVVARAARPDVRVVCVQTDGAAGLVARDGLPASLAVPLPPAGWLAALPAVPATLLLDDRGVLLWAAYEALDAEDARSLGTALAELGMHPSPALPRR